MSRVAFIGLGAMGRPMARRLVEAGHDVIGCDVRADAGEDLVAAGGRFTTDAREAARDADILWLMVVSGAQARDLLFGPMALAEALPRSCIVVAACTQSAPDARALGEDLARQGLAMLDAPVSGGVAGAEKGSLTIMASGPRDAFERARPVMEVMGSNLFDLGEAHGLGSTAKMINQHLTGVHIAAAAEAMALAERAGLPLDTMHGLIAVSAGNSWAWGNRGPRMMQAEPPVTSAVDIFVKDLGIVLAEGGDPAALPLASAAYSLFREAQAQGHGRADDSQVIRALRARASSKEHAS